MFLKNLLKKFLHLASYLSIRLRLTLLFVAIFGSTLVLFGFLTLDFISTELQKEFDGALYNYAVGVSDSISLNSTGDLSVITPAVDKQKIYPFSLGTALIQIRSSQGQILTQLGNFGDLKLPYKQDFLLLSKGEDVTYRTVTKLEGLPSKEAESYRIINFAIDNSPIPQLVLQIAVPLTFLESQIRSRKFFLELSIPLIILIATLGGFFLSTRALKPINEMINRVRKIGAQHLSDRLNVPLAKDELNNLALTLNEMLERIEQSFQNQERFIADASHQLLTPLSIMKGELDSATEPQSESLRQEVDQLISLVKNMLLLARTDAGFSALSLSKVYFEDLVLEAISRTEKIATKKNIRLKFNMSTERLENSERPLIEADEDLLINCIFNIIENAIKYSNPNSVVEIKLHWKIDSQILSVIDSGPGIAEQQLNLIFQRFSRLSTSSKTIPGYGLGLAIAKKIAELHKANLWAENKSLPDIGAVFRFEIKNI